MNSVFISLWLLVGSFPSVASAQQAKERALEQAIAARVERDEPEIRYFRSYVELNGDGKSEAIVYLLGKSVCGSSGCTTLIFTPSASGYRLVSEIGLTHPPIIVSPKTSHGWRNLIVLVAGGGIIPGYNAELQFDGTTYPHNPTVEPAKRIEGRVKGRTVIQENVRFASGKRLQRKQ